MFNIIIVTFVGHKELDRIIVWSIKHKENNSIQETDLVIIKLNKREKRGRIIHNYTHLAVYFPREF